MPFVRFLCVIFKQLHHHTHSKLDTCLYKLIYSEQTILPPKIFTIPPETHYKYECESTENLKSAIKIRTTARLSVS